MSLLEGGSSIVGGSGPWGILAVGGQWYLVVTVVETIMIWAR